ncbi:cytochrome c maturation protein CcmE [Neolewinella lacunae]|uniref:Cytochrome c maturation protein CcmE n=1 Tax=Neolewinella lacunae TaxID=1517758 RepID=A0A923T8F1_9BACT|nr:cytochrome c maturation protein CcmE [Neolewinella lacunae]MBC6994509.1 cytochrome c maturation protein CcmE [Neolewinella lacunae]MDN3634202.1 cytochrome c maturation protein CcmE [Neolewinella lacunae]
MKKTYIIALIMAVVAAVLVLNAGGEVAPYASFNTASESGESVKLVGTLVKDKPMVFDPLKDPNKFTFFLEDAEGTEREVVLLMGKPQDFEMSESIVLTGRMEGNTFIAKDVQLKCPSKYKDEESMIKDLVG